MVDVNIDFSNAVFTDTQDNEWELDEICLPNILILKHAEGRYNHSDHERLHVPFENIGIFSIRNLSICPNEKGEVKDGY